MLKSWKDIIKDGKIEEMKECAEDWLNGLRRMDNFDDVEEAKALMNVMLNEKGNKLMVKMLKKVYGEDFYKDYILCALHKFNEWEVKNEKLVEFIDENNSFNTSDRFMLLGNKCNEEGNLVILRFNDDKIYTNYHPQYFKPIKREV